MKITTAHIVKVLKEKHGWYIDDSNIIEKELIKDTRNVINDILKFRKNITIK